MLRFQCRLIIIVGDPYIILLYIICAYTQCVRVCQTNRRRFEEKKQYFREKKKQYNNI